MDVSDIGQLSLKHVTLLFLGISIMDGLFKQVGTLIRSGVKNIAGYITSPRCFPRVHSHEVASDIGLRN